MMDTQRSIKHGMAVGLAVMLALLLVSTSGGALAQDSAGVALDSTIWTLVAYGDPDAPQVVLPGSEITAIFDLDEGQISGSAGCNSYFAGFERDNDAITFSAIGSTLMACADENIMGQEQSILATLGAAESYAVTDGQLRITAGAQTLVFSPRLTLDSTIWTLVAYGDPDAPQVVLPGSEITVAFDLDAGQVSGSAGCNSYFAGFERGGDALAFTVIGTTEMACAEDIMAQEQGFLATLAAVESYTIRNGQLWLAAGEQILVFVSQAEALVSALIIITAPQNNAELEATQPIHIAGVGRGLFEGNVVVQALDADGNLLAEQPTTARGEDVGIGGTGHWAIDLEVSAETGAVAQITAFSPSPLDGSDLARDRIAVTIGAE